jgi:trigger factor
MQKKRGTAAASMEAERRMENLEAKIREPLVYATIERGEKAPHFFSVAKPWERHEALRPTGPRLRHFSEVAAQEGWLFGGSRYLPRPFIMNVEVDTLPNCIATLRVEVPAQQVSETMEAVTKEFAQYAKVPGFRAGKVPRHVVEQRFKKQIREELEKKLLQEATRQAISEKKLRVLSVQNVEDIELEDKHPMKFTATVVTQPEFDLPDYKGIVVKVPDTAVTDAEIDRSLDNIREQHADFKDVAGRALAMGDYAVIDYVGTIDGKPLTELFPKAGKPLGGSKDFWVRMGEDSFLPGFCAPLVGAGLNEERALQIEIPADFPVEEMRGQKIDYAVTVKGIKEKVLPELNDEFAGRVVKGRTLAELREMVKDEIARGAVEAAENAKRNQIMEHLAKSVECELPENLLRFETKRILGEIVRENQARGVADDTLKENQKELVGAASQGARERLKGQFILLRIADEEKITVGRTELQQRLAELARRYGMTLDKLVKELEKNDGLQQVHEDVLTGKVLAFLVANANVETAPKA